MCRFRRVFALVLFREESKNLRQPVSSILGKWWCRHDGWVLPLSYMSRFGRDREQRYDAAGNRRKSGRLWGKRLAIYSDTMTIRYSDGVEVRRHWPGSPGAVPRLEHRMLVADGTRPRAKDRNTTTTIARIVVRGREAPRGLNCGGTRGVAGPWSVAGKRGTSSAMCHKSQSHVVPRRMRAGLSGQRDQPPRW
jgi:hypothetical protein